MECFASNVTMISYCQFDDDIKQIIGVYGNTGPTKSGRSSFKKSSNDIFLEYDIDQKVRL